MLILQWRELSIVQYRLLHFRYLISSSQIPSTYNALHSWWYLAKPFKLCDSQVCSQIMEYFPRFWCSLLSYLHTLNFYMIMRQLKISTMIWSVLIWSINDLCGLNSSRSFLNDVSRTSDILLYIHKILFHLLLPFRLITSTHFQL